VSFWLGGEKAPSFWSSRRRPGLGRGIFVPAPSKSAYSVRGLFSLLSVATLVVSHTFFTDLLEAQYCRSSLVSLLEQAAEGSSFCPTAAERNGRVEVCPSFSSPVSLPALPARGSSQV